MPHHDHFALADNMIAHLNTVIGGVPDPFLTSRYIGFVAVSAVTVYELAIKEIFCTFASNKHKVLGNFTLSYFDRINGRIKLQTIRDDYIKRFGQKYLERFRVKIAEMDKNSVRTTGRSVLSSYNNIIEWRNQFAHQGQMPSTVTYAEVIQAYEDGKLVIDCLFKTMTR